MKYGSVLLLLVLSFGCRPAEAPPQMESAPATATYANPELIVETDWLASASEVVIVDARSADDYVAGHIPGAVNVPRSETFDPDAELRVVGPPEQIAEVFGRRGVNESAHVVVYDDGLSNVAARVFWTLEYYSHPRVSVLNGGFTKWKAEERDVSLDVPEPTPAAFDAVPHEDARSTKAEVLNDLDAAEVVMLDSRAPEEFTGEKLYSDRGGHVPDAVNIEWTRNFTGGEAPVLKSAAELNAMYEQEGVTQDKRVHAY